MRHRVHGVLLPTLSILMLTLFGCSIDVSSPNRITPSPLAGGVAPGISALTPAAGITPQTPLSPAPAADSAFTKIPVTWGSLKLAGRLVFTSADVQQSNPLLRIQILDLATGEESTIFRTAGLDWIYYMSVSPLAGQIVMSYAPPTGQNSSGQQALYTLPLDGSTPPELVFNPPTADDEYLQAEWSPDGRAIYYVHSNGQPQTAGQLYPIYEIFRMTFPGGQPVRIAENAFWPRISPDASQLVYISSSPVDGKNKIFLADADGGQARQVALAGSVVPDIIDAPIFSPDGQNLLFSAPAPSAAYQPNWLETLMGIQVAEAHTVPSDWWSVPLVGGTPKQLTHIQSPILFASVSPDGRYIASYSGNGLFVMKPDGTGLTTLIPDLGGIAGMVSWLP